MIDTKRDDALKRAFQLVEDEQFREARVIIETVLADDPDNADALWIYAHAVEDPNEAQEALRRLSDAMPDYPGIDDLVVQYQQYTLDSPRTEPASVTPFPEHSADDDDETDLDDEFEFDDEPETAQRSWLRRLVIASLVLVLVFVGIMIVLSGGRAGDDDPQPVIEATQTTVAVFVPPVDFEPEDEADENDAVIEQATPTDDDVNGIEEIVFTAEPQTVSDGVLSLLVGFDLARDDTDIRNTAIGVTEVIPVCGEVQDLRQIAQDVFATISASTEMLDPSASAVGVELVNCESNETLNRIGATLVDLSSFATGDMSLSDFIGRWVVLD